MADDTETDDFENLPEGTDRVVVLHRSLACTVPKDREFPDHVTPRETPGMRHNKAVRFTEGDAVPLDIADRCWSGFSDRLAAFSADGDRLDAPSRCEESGFSQAVHEIPRRAE